MTRAAWPALLLLAALAPAARAEMLPDYPLPHLTTTADTIVVAVPKDKVWTVEQVLLGTALKKGDPVPQDLYNAIPVSVPIDPFPSKPAAQERTATRALVFLAPRPGAKGPVERLPLVSGVRLASADGRVLRPVQLMNPGGYYYLPISDAKWEDTVKTVAAFLPEMAKVRELKGLPDPAARNRAILQWLTEHEAEIRNAGYAWQATDEPVDFGGDSPKKKPQSAVSWGTLPEELFTALSASDRPADVWQAALLWQQTYPQSSALAPEAQASPAFQTPAGREMLLATATNLKAPLNERRLALTFPQAGFASVDPHKDLATYTRDRKAYIARLLPLINDPDDTIREYVFRYLAYACNRRDGYYDDFRYTDVLQPFLDRYAIEPPGHAQNALARGLVQVGGPEAWHKLTGNPNGLLGLLTGSYDPKTRLAHLTINLEGRSEPKVYAPPTARAQRISNGKVAQTTLPLVFSYLPQPWSAGWGPGHGCLQPTLDLAALPPGTYHLRLQGTVGQPPTTQRWTSEPLLVTIP